MSNRAGESYPYKDVKDPVYINPEKSQIRCTVTFEHLGRPLSFVAYKYDVHEHCREIFHDCDDGKYGPVGEFVETPREGI